MTVSPAGKYELQFSFMLINTRTCPEKLGVKEVYTLLATPVQGFPVLLNENDRIGSEDAPSLYTANIKGKAGDEVLQVYTW